MRLAISPPLCPPIPSATTKSPSSATTAKLSWFWLRRRPISVGAAKRTGIVALGFLLLPFGPVVGIERLYPAHGNFADSHGWGPDGSEEPGIRAELSDLAEQ